MFCSLGISSGVYPWASISHAPSQLTRPPHPRGQAASDTESNIQMSVSSSQWRALCHSRRLNKDEMEFLCLVTNRGKGPGVKSMRICEYQWQDELMSLWSSNTFMSHNQPQLTLCVASVCTVIKLAKLHTYDKIHKLSTRCLGLDRISNELKLSNSFLVNLNSSFNPNNFSNSEKQ